MTQNETKKKDSKAGSGSIHLYEKFMASVTFLALMLMILNIVVHRRTTDSRQTVPLPMMDMAEKNRERVGKKMAIMRKNDKGITKVTRSTNKLNLILSGEVNMIDLRVHSQLRGNDEGDSSYHGINGRFCKLDWNLHKTDPSTFPMFKDLIARSPNCRDTTFEYPIESVIRAINDGAKTTSLTLSGLVFHESRCGSTLVANTLSAVSPQQHRVYSESGPFINAVRACDGDPTDRWGSHCQKSKHLALIRDVVTLMGLTNDLEEKRLFYKVQSIGTKSIDVVRAAFPTTPWVFVYRDPVQVMMSHLKTEGTRMAVCLRARGRPQSDLVDYVKKKGMDVKSLSSEEHCAAHLATLCLSAWRNQEASDTGIMLNYVDIPGRLLDEVFPNHFDIAVTQTERDRVMKICSKYSKGRGHREGGWESDNERKDTSAWPALKEASDMFLKEVTEKLSYPSGSDAKER